MKSLNRFRSLCSSDQSGQAMVEYALLNFGVLAGAGSIGWWVIVPRVIEAYDIHIHGYYLVLGLPFP